MKKAQQMRTIFPIGLKEEIKVSTTSFSPGALLMTLEEMAKQQNFQFLCMSCYYSGFSSSAWAAAQLTQPSSTCGSVQKPLVT